MEADEVADVSSACRQKWSSAYSLDFDSWMDGRSIHSNTFSVMPLHPSSPLAPHPSSSLPPSSDVASPSTTRSTRSKSKAADESSTAGLRSWDARVAAGPRVWYCRKVFDDDVHFPAKLKKIKLHAAADPAAKFALTLNQEEEEDFHAHRMEVLLYEAYETNLCTKLLVPLWSLLIAPDRNVHLIPVEPAPILPRWLTLQIQREFLPIPQPLEKKRIDYIFALDANEKIRRMTRRKEINLTIWEQAPGEPSRIPFLAVEVKPYLTTVPGFDQLRTIAYAYANRLSELLSHFVLKTDTTFTLPLLLVKGEHHHFFFAYFKFKASGEIIDVQFSEPDDSESIQNLDGRKKIETILTRILDWAKTDLMSWYDTLFQNAEKSTFVASFATRQGSDATDNPKSSKIPKLDPSSENDH